MVRGYVDTIDWLLDWWYLATFPGATSVYE